MLDVQSKSANECPPQSEQFSKIKQVYFDIIFGLLQGFDMHIKRIGEDNDRKIDEDIVLTLINEFML